MSSVLDELQGQVVVDLREIHDYWQLEFEDGLLTINNPLSALPESVLAMPSLVHGLVLEEVSDKPDAISFHFSNGSQLTIDLRPEATTVPERLVYRRSNGPTVVW